MEAAPHRNLRLEFARLAPEEPSLRSRGPRLRPCVASPPGVDPVETVKDLFSVFTRNPRSGIGEFYDHSLSVN